MYVLYRELKTFDHLESYIAQNDLSVIYSNVAISWAIHDQNLDESIDISNKTTTNISAIDFCKSVDLGQYFSHNQETFHQQFAIERLKTRLWEFRKVYDLLEDEKSKAGFFALVMFCLCPYTTRFFRGLFAERLPDLDFSKNDMEYIITNQLEIGLAKPTLVLSLLYQFQQLTHLPILLSEINEKQSFTLRLYQEGGKYQGILTAKPEPEPVTFGGFSAEEEAPVTGLFGGFTTVEEMSGHLRSQEPSLDEPTDLEDILGESERLREEVGTLEEMFQEIAQTEEPSWLEKTSVVERELGEAGASLSALAKEMGIWESLSSEIETEEVEETPSDREGVLTTEETDALDALLRDIDLPPPEQEGTLGRDQVDVKVALNRILPVLPEMDSVMMPRDTLQKSMDLLRTMEDLVGYLKGNYPTEDPLCQDLLDSMGAGLTSLQNMLATASEQ